jgi:hypothetical protein
VFKRRSNGCFTAGWEWSSIQNFAATKENKHDGDGVDDHFVFDVSSIFMPQRFALGYLRTEKF